MVELTKSISFFQCFLCVYFICEISYGAGADVGWLLNTLRPRQNGRHFADDIFKCIFLNENVWISLKISLKFVPKIRINNILTLVQIMAWRRPGDKPLSEPMMITLPTHICDTRPQWVKRYDIIWALRHLKSPKSWLFVQQCLSLTTKK